MSFPINNCVFFHSYVSLPEGIDYNQQYGNNILWDIMGYTINIDQMIKKSVAVCVPYHETI